jgi:transcriptional regulator of acetoin/glycerol metabolism
VDLVDGDASGNRRARYADLIAIAQSEMDRLHEQIRGSGYALVLTDATGAVLYEKSDASLPNVTLERMGPGVPVHGAGQEVIAVLDAACLPSAATRASHLHMLALISLSAHLIEKCLFLRHHRHHAVLRFHLRPELVNLLHDGALALAPDGTVIGADSSSAGRCATYLTPRRRTSSRWLWLTAPRSGRCVIRAADSVSMRVSTAAPLPSPPVSMRSRRPHGPRSCRWPQARVRMR